MNGIYLDHMIMVIAGILLILGILLMEVFLNLKKMYYSLDTVIWILDDCKDQLMGENTGALFWNLTPTLLFILTL